MDVFRWGRALSICGGLGIGLSGWPLLGSGLFLSGWLTTELMLRRTHQELARRADDQRAVEEIGEAAFAARSSPVLVEQLCEILKRRWGFPWVSIELLSETGRQIVGGDDCTQCLVETLICIPLLVGDRLLGTLTLGHPQATAMTSERLSALHLASGHLALLIEGRRTQELELAVRDSQLQAARLKSTFLTTISHELRTPLNGLLGMAALLEDSELAPDQREQLLAAIASAERLQARVEDMLLFTELMSEGAHPCPSTLDLRTLIQDCVDRAAPQAAAAGLSLELETADEVPDFVQGDPRLTRIVSSLIDNAVRFTPSGEVHVRVGRSGSAIQFHVQDTGVGLEPERISQIFEPFVQLDGSATREFGGAGLGLAIAQRLTTLLGGTLEVESQLGVGSLFRCRLPLPEVAAPREQVTAIRPAATDHLPVLVVDDDPVNRRLAQALLDRLGAPVVLASNGAEAVAAFERDGPFRLILMDCHMPVMDGFAATEWIRDREQPEARTPVLALTADRTDHNRIRCVAAGMDDLLAKPIRPAALKSALAQHSNACRAA